MSCLKIAIYPYGPDIPNKYIDRMEETIRYAFPNVVITAVPNIRNLFHLKGYNFVWFNWFENLPKNGKVKNLLKKIFFILALKLMKIRIIMTLHNRQPHESDNSLLDKFLFWLTFTCASRIIILSSDSKQILKEQFGDKILRKTILIPHPTYACLPKNKMHDNGKFSILFFGNLRPYKNIELILKLAQICPDTSFTIAGQAINKKYETELNAKVKCLSNVTLISHFLTEEEIDNLIASHSILLLPYDIKSSLNSGVIIHAICKRINIIVPEIGTINQLKNKDMAFHYTYNSREEHLEKLAKMVNLAKGEYENNVENFQHRIEVLYNEVTRHQNPKALSEKVKELFK